MFDAVLLASAVERMTAPYRTIVRWVWNDFRQVGDLDAAVSKLDESELGGPINRHEQGEPTFLGADLGNIDVEVSDRS